MRLDHFFSAIFDLANFSDGRIEIIDRHNVIRVMPSSFILTKEEVGNAYISFFALKENTFISLEGFKYPLNFYELNLLDNLTLSNELAEEVGTVTITQPILLMITKDA